MSTILHESKILINIPEGLLYKYVYTGNLKMAKSLKEEGKITLVNDSRVLICEFIFFF